MRLTEFCDRFGIQFNRIETVEIFNRGIQEYDKTAKEWHRYLLQFFPDNQSLNKESVWNNIYEYGVKYECE